MDAWPYATAFKARPYDKPISKAGPMKISHFTWVPDMAKVFNRIPIIAGTLRQLIGTDIHTCITPFVNAAAFLKRVVTVGTTQPLNMLLTCQPLKLPAMGVQPFMVPVMCMAGPFQPKTMGYMGRSMGAPMNLSNVRKPKKSSIPVRHRVIMGLISGMGAIVIIHPLDVVKIRMQLYPMDRTIIQMMRRIVDCEGTKALYAGLTAGLLRQATYTSTRLAIYLSLLDRYELTHGNNVPPFDCRLGIAILAGMAGAFVGTPSEVALIRMVAASRERRSACSPYCSPACKSVVKSGNAISVLYRLFRKEGLRELWRGATPTLLRSFCVSNIVVCSYGEIQSILKSYNVKRGIQRHAYSAIITCYITAFITLPIDAIKTTFQIHRSEATILQMTWNMFKENGAAYFWKGFRPYYTRLTLYTFMTYYFMDTLMDLYLEAKRVLA